MATYRGAEIDLTPTAEMAEEAQRGLDWREEFNRGGTAVGVTRANQLVNREELSARTVRRMVSYFARHEVDKDAEGFNEGEEGFPSAGRIAWQLWGGDAGKAWSERKTAQLDRIDSDASGEKVMTTMQRKFMAGSVQAESGMGPRQIRVIASDATIDRAGDVLAPEGCMYPKDKTIPVLVDHNASVDSLVGRARIEVKNGRVEALIDFLDEGVSAKADDACAKAKAGVLDTVSVGFKPVEAEPNKSGGLLYKRWELMELSMVAIPANPSAQVIERSATVSVSAEELAALKAKAEIPGKLAAEFRALAKTAPKAQKGAMLRLANMAEKSAGGTVAKVAAPLTGKSLWHIGYLASTLAELGWIHDCVEDEAEWTNDESAVPGMLADALRQIGAALVTLTQEEVAEMMADLAGEEAGAAAEAAVDGDMTVKDLVGALKGKPIAALTVKAGRVLSTSNETALKEARDKIDGVLQQATPADDADEMETRAAEIRAMEIKAFEASIAA